MKNEEIFLMSIKNKNEDTNLFSNFFFSIEKSILHSSFFILFSFSSSSLPDLKRRNKQHSASAKGPLPRRMCSAHAHVIGAISRGRACTCENGPSFLTWKQVPARGLVSEMCTSKRTAVFALFWSKRDSHPPFHACISCRSPASRK